MTNFLNSDKITGVTMQYFVTCPREAWLFGHKISPDQEDENILMGRALAEMKDEENFFHLKIDRIDRSKGHLLVTEYKKSLKNIEGAKAQLLFYLYMLQKSLRLKRVEGKIISGKKVIFVEGSEENFAYIEHLLQKLDALLSQPKPPPVKKIPFCRQCGYRNYCF